MMMFGFIKSYHFILKLFRGMHILYVFTGYFSVNWLSTKKMFRFLVPQKFKNNGIILSPQERLKQLLEKLGPTFVKFGQIIADRPDIVSEKLRNELKKLQSHAKPFDHDQALILIEAELSAPVTAIFKSFDLQCIGSASMGQVYKAVLKTGEVVVVKIQRPYIKEKINLDLQILAYLAQKISKEFPELIVINLEGIVEEFGETLRKELNYFHEAANARRFSEMFRDVPHCKIPKVYEELSTSKLLVMEYIDGVTPSSKKRLLNHQLDPKIVAANGVDVFLKMIFEHGFFHADPHCGNMFVLKNNQIGLIDFGMVGSLKPSQMEFLAKFVRALSERDASMLCDSILLLNNNKNFREREDLEFSLDEMLKNHKGIAYENMKVSQILDDCFKIIRKSGITIPTSIFLLIKSIATIEKVGLHLDPQISVAEHLRPYAEKLIKKQYTPKSIAKSVFKSLKKYIDLGKNLPDEVSDILYSLKSGKFTHDIKFNNEAAFAKSIKQTGKTIALALLVGIIVLATSFVISKGQAGLFTKIAFGISLVYSFVTISRLLRTSKI